MELPHTGTYGAKRMSSYKASPRNFWKSLIDRNQGKSDETVKAILHEKSREKIIKDFQRNGNTEFLDAILEYSTANGFTSLQRERAAPTPVEREAKQFGTARVIENIKREKMTQLVREVQVAFWDTYRLSSGKLLKEATFAEVAKDGGFLSRLATMGKPSQIVGEVLTDKQVKAALKAG